MNDKFGRNITYLRLSVTDLCNLRCIYCMPECDAKKLQHSDILSVEEIEVIVRIAVNFGIEKVRITGGEPLVRSGIIEICRRIAAIDGVKELCLTTNGILLPQLAQELKTAGVDRLNISIDTLNPNKYETITRLGKLSDVLKGLKAAKQAGFKNTKINTVLIGGINDDEIVNLVELTRNEDIEVRFIELMPIGECIQWAKSRFISNDVVLKAVPELQEIGESGVARIYQAPDFKGKVGLISPISSNFCANCNRIRITADGNFKQCLHSLNEISLKGLNEAQLEESIHIAIHGKPKKHNLNKNNSSDSLRNMNMIGG